MLNYTKLWILLENKGMRKTDLTKNKIISTATLAKLGKNETITSDTIDKLCEFLKCQPADIMEYIDEKQIAEMSKQVESVNKALAEQMKAMGITEEQFATMFSQVMNESIKSMFHGGKSLEEINNNVIELNLKKKE